MEIVRKLRMPKFEKTASKFILGDNPATYPSELLAHLYKQHAYLGKYKVNMSIEGQEKNLGYMYGVFTVSHSSAVPPGPGTERMGEMIRQPETADPNAQDKQNELRIPIIVESKKAYSFDVFISPDGRFLPLNEERVSAALFDMSPYLAAPSPEGEIAGASQNFAPMQPASATGGAAVNPNAVVKQASVLDLVSASIDVSMAEAFLQKVAGDQSLKDALSLNETFGKAIVKIAQSVRDSSQSPPKSTAKNFDEFDATVISKVGGAYVLKMASADGSSQEMSISNVDGQEIPVSIRQNIIDNGHTLIVSDSNKELISVEKTASLKPVESNGVYSVMTKAGAAQRAAVITDVISLDGRPMDLCLVVGKSGASFQEKVAGVSCGDLNLESLSGSDPDGDGIFIYKESGVVTEPITILHKIEDDGEDSYLYDHPIRGRGTIKLSNVQKPLHISGNDYLFPETATFVPLSFGGRYSADMVSMDKIASRQDQMMEVFIHSDGSEFTFSGRPVHGLTKKAGLNSTEALLLLGVLGDTPEGAMKKIASASKKTVTSFVALRQIGETGQEKTAVDEEVAKIAQVINIDLTKEAASFSNASTVDSVLSLNFVTPENIQGYVDAIPALEEASSKLAELLVGVRLGLSDVPENAVSSSLKGIERAVQGLKKLQIRASVST